jgi:AcrR family transcriptional regulator
MVKKCNCREQILNAAQTVVMEAGAGHMSLDIVAKKAGVSKGGLMYHFPTKEALLKAMLVRMIEEFYMHREEKEKDIVKPAGRLLKAGVLATMARDPKKDRMGLAILAVAAHDPHLLEPLRAAYASHLKELEGSGMKFERAAIISLASDAFMLQELLGVSSYSAVQKNRIKAEMIRMVDEGVAG